MKAVVTHPVQATEFESIVRALAEMDPFGDENWCEFCLLHRTTGHADSCLWLRAQKALGGNVSGDRQPTREEQLAEFRAKLAACPRQQTRLVPPDPPVVYNEALWQIARLIEEDHD